MAIFSIDELRASAPAQFRTASDESLLREYAKSVGMDPFEVANTLGYDPGKGSLTNERLSASTDNYQAGLYGVGEAVTGAMGLKSAQRFMRSGRQDNEFQANVASQRAKELGGIDSYKDVDGVGTGLNYLGGLGAQMLPYAAEAATGGLAVRGLSTGLRAAVGAGRAAEATTEVMRAGLAAQKSLNNRALAGGVAASYPSSVGDILQNQRDQLRSNGLDDGQTDLLSAGVGGVAYAGLNALSPSERLLTQGGIGRGIGALDKMQGVKGGLARTGMNAAGAGALEGVNETGQEFINQGFGRMAVDPNETFFNEKSNERFGESFVGGAAMGGVMGGAAGGWRRSNAAVAKEAEEGRTADLLSQQQAAQDTQYQQQQGLRTDFVRQQHTQQLQDLDGEESSGYPGTAESAWQVHQQQQEALRQAERLKQSQAVVENDQFQSELTPNVQSAVADAQGQQQAQQQQAEQAQAAESAKQHLLQHTVSLYGEPAQGTTPGGTAPVFNWLGIAHYQPQAAQAAIAKQAEADAKRIQEHQAAPGVAEQAEQIYASVYRQAQQQRQQAINDPTDPKAQAQPVKPAIFKAQNFAKLVTGAGSLVEVADRVANELAIETEKGGKSPVAAQRIAELELFKARLDAVNGVEPSAPAQNSAPEASAPTGANPKFKRAPKPAAQATPAPVQPTAPTEPTTLGGVPIQQLPYVEPKRGSSANGDTSLDISRARETVTAALAHPKLGPVVSEITGLSLAEDGSLAQVADPIPMAQVAAKLNISRQGLAQSLQKNVGVDDVVIGRAVGSFHAVQSTAAEDTGAEDVGFNENIRAATYDVDGTSDNDMGFDATQDPEVMASMNRSTGDLSAGDTVAELGMESLAETGTENAGVRVSDSLAKAAGEGFVSVLGVKPIPTVQTQAAAAFMGDKKAIGMFLNGDRFSDARNEWNAEVPFADLTTLQQLKWVVNFAIADDFGRTVSTRAKNELTQSILDEHQEARKNDGGGAVPRTGVDENLAKGPAAGNEPRPARQGKRVGSQAETPQAPAAQGADQPGGQAAELSPAVQAKIDEHQAAIADYEKLLACLRGRG